METKIEAENKRSRTSRKTEVSTESAVHKISIELTRYKALLEALGDYRKVFRIILIIATITILIFAGITVVVLSVKRIYPYSDITINALGATTIKNEKTEVSYWLFNTAELWANSGIKVKSGQTIIISASGKKHTAIHQLLKDVLENNIELTKPWVGTDGIPEQTSTNKIEEKDKARSRYRIFPNQNQDALLVQVVPSGRKCQDRPEDGNNQIMLVGKKQEIRIEQDGELYFAVNDVVLDDETIARMMLEVANDNDYSRSTDYSDLSKVEKIKKSLAEIKRIRKELILEKSGVFMDSVKLDSVYNDFLKPFGGKAKIFAKDKKYGRFKLGENDGSNHIELFGYFMNNYKEPWFDDNVGSFLIMVETITE